MSEQATKATKVLVAMLVFAGATAISVAMFRGRGIGLFIDGALLFGLFFYLATLRSHRQR